MPTLALAQESEQEEPPAPEQADVPTVAVVPAPELDEDEPAAPTTRRPLVTAEQPICRADSEEEEKPAEVIGADRVFAGHRFLILGSQRSALIMSSFNFEQSVFGLDIPRFAIGSDDKVYDVATEGLGELLGFSLKVSKFMSLDAAAVMRIQHGPDAPSLLFRGAAYQIGGVLGATFQIFSDEEMGLQVSARPWFAYTSSRNFSALAFVEGATELGVNATSDQVLTTTAADYYLEVTSEMSGGGSLLMAYTWDEAVAVQASIDAAWSEQESDRALSDRGEVITTDYIMAAMAGSIEYDFKSRGLPVAFAAEYKVTYGRLADNPFPTTSSRVSHRLGTGAYYTGRDDLQLGLTYYALLGLPRLEAIDAVPTDPVRESAPAVVKMVAFNLYYFW